MAALRAGLGVLRPVGYLIPRSDAPIVEIHMPPVVPWVPRQVPPAPKDVEAYLDKPVKIWV